MNTLTNIMKTTLKTVVDFYDQYPEFIGQLTVNTQHGFKTIEYADVTAYDSEIIRVEVGSKVIEGSPDHLLFGEKN